jgi:hypothetical protein
MQSFNIMPEHGQSQKVTVSPHPWPDEGINAPTMVTPYGGILRIIEVAFENTRDYQDGYDDNPDVQKAVQKLYEAWLAFKAVGHDLIQKNPHYRVENINGHNGGPLTTNSDVLPGMHYQK